MIAIHSIIKLRIIIDPPTEFTLLDTLTLLRAPKVFWCFISNFEILLKIEYNTIGDIRGPTLAN